MDKIRKEYLIEKSLSSTLTNEEQAEFAILCKNDPSILSRIDQEKILLGKFANMDQERFKPFFEARVMRQINQEQNDFHIHFPKLITRFFPRISIPAFVCACILMISNVQVANADTDLIDALFGLPSENAVEFIIF